MSKRWYVVHAYSGFEKVFSALTERVARSGMADFFGRILVPVEKWVEIKGQRSPYPNASSSPVTCWWKWNERRHLASRQRARRR